MRKKRGVRKERERKEGMMVVWLGGNGRKVPKSRLDRREDVSNTILVFMTTLCSCV